MAREKRQKQSDGVVKASGPAQQGRQRAAAPPVDAKQRRSPRRWPPLGAAALALALAALLLALYAGRRADDLRRAAGGGGDVHGAVPPEPPAADGDRLLGPSFGLYPRGCRWREVTYANGSAQVDYLFWDYAVRNWTAARPPACVLRAHPRPGPRGWSFLNGTPRTEVTPHKTHVVYRNLWYNNGRWYALVDGPKHVAAWRFSRNQEISPLHVESARAFANAVAWRAVPGDTLLFDYAFFTHPTAIGHWWEMRISFKRPCDTFVLLHLQRRHLPEWVRAVVAVALGVGPSQQLPPVVLQEPTDNKYAQPAMPLEGVPRDEWVVFDRVLIVRDVFTGGSRSFASTEDAHEFRAAVYAHYGLPPPAPRAAVPRTVTFQRKRANRRVVNEAQLLALLSEFGAVSVVEFNASSSLHEQLLAMRGTGLFVSVHTSNLANAPFLQPGSAVVEFIPRHWSWMGLDRSFKEQTSTMGDIHHWAWRANGANESRYLRPRDAVRFEHWSKDACSSSEDCVEAQTESDLVVDLAALRALLEGRMPMVWAGARAAEAELPWPPEA
ncbi:hypothetical protein Rsub_06689 [Raphidocelis subcapitata]|uniref:Glycosyltransferase 61 catalytic domain-containing protein n=1 Tax=Raphidocelis subcapitata TaxID=307507 RepID=A0A2V0P3Y1_9CHLO|nr:hypothetical protein Rsub_06689 [Raphidocelis subcapitata]|eukprot:GBF94574.1 hypothetical protein Rsub_06689 [Raphidocelis subcapitata]